jgi:hypothetical protein
MGYVKGRKGCLPSGLTLRAVSHTARPVAARSTAERKRELALRLALRHSLNKNEIAKLFGKTRRPSAIG